MCAATRGAARPRLGTRVRRHPSAATESWPTMHRYFAPLGFTIAAAWVVVLFVLTAKP